MTLDEFLKLPGAKVHDGSGCPVDGPASVLYRDGTFFHWDDATTEDWEHVETDPFGDIIAYREVQP